MKSFKEFVNEGLRQAMSGRKETAAQKQRRQEKDNFDLYKKRQKRVAALRGDKSSRQLTPKQQRDYLRRVNLDQIRAMEGIAEADKQELEEVMGQFKDAAKKAAELAKKLGKVITIMQHTKEGDYKFAENRNDIRKLERKDYEIVDTVAA
jgi:sugar phosphate isomerase/epimerase|tara:strand:- start:173 stop:622 length:450 start_codon:yes stop_codon:yes gene_type:complete